MRECDHIHLAGERLLALVLRAPELLARLCQDTSCMHGAPAKPSKHSHVTSGDKGVQE